MTQTAPATPCLAKVPLDADRQAYALLIVYADRAIAPQPALRQVVEFESTPHGGFISAAQAHDGGWGYINEQGQWLVPPTLDNARGFTEDGVARFCRAGRWGYLNLLGQEVIAPQFDEARPLRNGLAAVKTGPHAWRIINLQGQFTCAATFADLGNFGAVGLAPAQPWDPDRDLPLWGYVDHRGQWVVAPRFAQAHSFDEQAVAAVSANGKTWGLINAQGQWVLQPCHARMDAFNSEALAYYAEAATGDGPCGYLNTRGKVAVRGGQGLSHQMACGLVADRTHETRFFDLHGAPLPGPALSYATDFQPELECAVARLASTTSPDANPWGLLHTDGRLVPAPQGLREPLTQSDGSIPPTQPDTALVPFLASDGQVVWIDREGQVVWRARYDGGQVIFCNAQDQILWRSPVAASHRAPRAFFQPHAADWLEHLEGLDHIVPAATALAHEAESRLHAWAQAQEPYAAQPMAQRRVVHAHLGPAQRRAYPFMEASLHEALAHARQALVQHLQAQWGMADPDPEHAAPAQSLGTPLAAWRRPLQTPLAPSPTSGEWVNLPEANALWISLYPQTGADESGAWWSLWLMAAPSVDALLAAQHAREAVLAHTAAPSLNTAEEAENTEAPTTRAAWLAAVLNQPQALGQVPAAWLDDAMVDAALQAHPAALAQVPAALQTPARLEALLRRGVEVAVQIPPHCMTRDALLLARELYAGDPTWDARDERCSQPLAQPTAPVLWGCLLTPEQALHALQAGVPLCDMPHWLRTDALEQAALDADIANLAHLAPSQITPALAQRAVLHTNGRLIRHVPAELLTPALCLASAQANGLTLQDIPPPLRSLEVCVAALEDQPDMFPLVPTELAVAVTTALIDNDLARAREQGAPREGSAWHVARAWAQLAVNQPQAAVDDALRGLPHVPAPQHAHYVLARAYQALGHTAQAALAACSVLSLQSPYQPAWCPTEDTGWLTALARWHMGHADEATLIHQLALHPQTLADMPRARITPAMVDAALAADPATVRWVPKRLMTPAHYAVALRVGVKRPEDVPPAMVMALDQATQAQPAASAPAMPAPRPLQAERRAQPPAEAPRPPHPGTPRVATPWAWWLLGTVLRSAVGHPASARGLVHWLEQRPLAASALHALLSLLAVALHTTVSVAVWLAEGPEAGLGTFVLVGFADAYWAWQFAWEATRPSLTLAASAVVLYLVVWCPLYRKAGRALGHPRQTSS